MSGLRLYRKFYTINHNLNGEIYTLFPPSSLSVNSYDTNTNNLIEGLTPISSSTGIYYVDLNGALYNSSVVYELRWSVNYTNIAPTKILQTLFKYDANIPNNLYVFGEIDFELENNNNITYEVQEQKEIMIEIVNNQ